MSLNIPNIIRENFNNQQLPFNSLFELSSKDSLIFKTRINNDQNKEILDINKKCEYCKKDLVVEINWAEDEFHTLCCDHSLYGDDLFNEILEFDFVLIDDLLSQQAKNIDKETKHSYRAVHRSGISAIYLIYSEYTQNYYDFVKSISEENKNVFDSFLKNKEFIKKLKNDYDIFNITTNPFEVSLVLEDPYFFKSLNKHLDLSLSLENYICLEEFKHSNFYYQSDKEDIWKLILKKDWAIDLVNQKIKNKENLYYKPEVFLLSCKDLEIAKVNNGINYMHKNNMTILKNLLLSSVSNFKNFYNNSYKEPSFLLFFLLNLKSLKHPYEKIKIILKDIDLDIRYQNITFKDLLEKIAKEKNESEINNLIKKIMFLIECETN